MKHLILELIQHSIPFGLLVAALTYLAKNIFEAFINKDIEKFKSTLEMSANEYKSELERINYEHSRRFPSVLLAIHIRIKVKIKIMSLFVSPY